MSRKAEQWLAEQEVAILEAIYELHSPPEGQDRQRPIWVEAADRSSFEVRFND